MAREIYYLQGVYGDKLDKSIYRVVFPVVVRVFKEFYEPFVRITSTYESSAHGAGSYHYSHKAVDIGEPMNKPIIEELVAKIKEELGKDYYVLWHNNHIHIHYRR